MQIAFCSNFLSAHQRPLCDALYETDGCRFCFIAVAPLSDTRKAMGWQEERLPYVIASYESDATYQAAVDYVKNADVLIVSGDEENEFFKIAVKNKKTMIFRCCERPYKNGRWRAVSPKGLALRWNSYFKHPKENLYMLCSSAYAAGDYAVLGSYLGRCYKWGYFVKVETLDVETVLAQKEENYIFWAGRLLNCKHPETAICVAAYLKARNIPFQMDIAGDGPMRETLQRLVAEKGLAEQVRLIGNLTQEETALRMQRASIYLATSDYREGWGAVVGEAMSKACAVVACQAMGSAPFLIQNGDNGYIYPYGNRKRLCRAVEKLLTDKTLRCSIGRHAYKTMISCWNPTVAAKRLLQMVERTRNGDKRVWSDGPCSKAHIFKKGR